MKVKLFFIFIFMAKTALASPPCPATMVWAILTNNSRVIGFLLEVEDDPNATLEGCQIEVNESIATLMSQRDPKIIFWTSFNEIPENPSLLDLALLSKNQQIIDLLTTDHEAK